MLKKWKELNIKGVDNSFFIGFFLLLWPFLLIPSTFNLFIIFNLFFLFLLILTFLFLFLHFSLFLFILMLFFFLLFLCICLYLDLLGLRRRFDIDLLFFTWLILFLNLLLHYMLHLIVFKECLQFLEIFKVLLIIKGWVVFYSFIVKSH